MSDTQEELIEILPDDPEIVKNIFNEMTAREVRDIKTFLTQGTVFNTEEDYDAFLSTLSERQAMIIKACDEALASKEEDYQKRYNNNVK